MRIIFTLLLMLSVAFTGISATRIALPFDADFRYEQTVNDEKIVFHGHLALQKPFYAHYEIKGKITLITNDQGSWFFDRELEEINHQPNSTPIPLFNWLISGTLPQGATLIEQKINKSDGVKKITERYRIKDSSIDGDTILVYDDSHRLLALMYSDPFGVKHHYQFTKHSFVQHDPSFFEMDVPEGVTVMEVKNT